MSESGSDSEHKKEVHGSNLADLETANDPNLFSYHNRSFGSSSDNDDSDNAKPEGLSLKNQLELVDQIKEEAADHIRKQSQSSSEQVQAVGTQGIVGGGDNPITDKEDWKKEQQVEKQSQSEPVAQNMDKPVDEEAISLETNLQQQKKKDQISGMGEFEELPVIAQRESQFSEQDKNKEEPMISLEQPVAEQPQNMDKEGQKKQKTEDATGRQQIIEPENKPVSKEQAQPQSLVGSTKLEELPAEQNIKVTEQTEQSTKDQIPAIDKKQQQQQPIEVQAQIAPKQQPLPAESSAVYDQEMQDDLQMMKNQFNGKKKSTNKIFSAIRKEPEKNEKNKMNKTVVPGKISEFDESEDMKIMELNMIRKMAHEKKKTNYQLLKQWDKRRAEHLAVHRKLIDTLQTEVHKRIKSSIENMEIYQTFFNQKARQQEKYVSHPIINTRYALQNNSLSKNVYINCSVILNSLSDENQVRCRKINDFIQILRNDILREIIENHLNSTQRELLRSREKISTLKNSLRKYNLETEQKTSDMALFFGENALNMNISSEKDFYLAQVEFLRKASKQTMVQKKLGEYCLEYYQLAVDEQNKRSSVIREAMLTFTKGLSQCYNVGMDPAQIEQLSKGQEKSLISEFYSLEEIFEERFLTLFKESEKIPASEDIKIGHLQSYLNKFDFERFDCRMSLLKQFNVKYLSAPKNQSTSEDTCLLVITVDYFIHLFLGQEKTGPYSSPDVTFRADQKNLEVKTSKDRVLELILKDERRGSMLSYFWETKNDKVYRLEFAKKDSREEFMDYLSRIKA